MSPLPNRALSLRQPWCDAVIHGGKRIENRTAWTNSNFRGDVLIHAAKGCTVKEYMDAMAFRKERGLTKGWSPPATHYIAFHAANSPMPRGGIVGVATVVGIILASGFVSGSTKARPAWEVRHLTDLERKWWMGGFALVLDNVKSLPFVECRGALGFFKVGDEVLRRLGGV